MPPPREIGRARARCDAKTVNETTASDRRIGGIGVAAVSTAGERDLDQFAGLKLGRRSKSNRRRPAAGAGSKPFPRGADAALPTSGRSDGGSSRATASIKRTTKEYFGPEGSISLT